MKTGVIKMKKPVPPDMVARVTEGVCSTAEKAMEDDPEIGSVIIVMSHRHEAYDECDNAHVWVCMNCQSMLIQKAHELVNPHPHGLSNGHHPN